MNRSNVAVLVSLVSALSGTLAGCGTAHEADVTTGVYALTVTRESDTCALSRPAGALGHYAIVANADRLVLGVPGALEESGRVLPGLVARPDAAGLHHELETATGCGSASVRRAYTVMTASGPAVELLYAEEWTGVPTCATPTISQPMPRTNCTAELRLTYELVQACAAPCSLRTTATGTTSCVCD